MRIAFALLLIITSFHSLRAAIRTNLGVSFLAKSNIRRGDTSTSIFNLQKRGDATFMILPVISLRSGRLSFSGRSLQYGFGGRIFSFAFSSEYGGDRYNSEGMVRRKSSIFAGASVRLLFFRFRLRRDILPHRSNGTLLTVSTSKSFALLQALILRMALGIEYYNDNYVDYYFGVSEDEVMASYQGSSSVNHYGSIILTYLVAKGWNISWFTLYRTYGDGIRNSPTVKSHQELVASLSTSFSF